MWASVAVAAFAAVSLAGCSIQGNRAQEWLDGSTIIESTTLDLTGCSAMCDPRVAGKIIDSASEEQIRVLAEGAADYLPSEGDDVTMVLDYGKVDFEIASTPEETTELVDLAVGAFRDDRVSSASIDPSGVFLSAPTAHLTALFRQYNVAQNAPVTMKNDDDEHRSLSISEAGETCAVSEPLLAEFDRLVADPAVSAIALELCTSLDVTISDPATRDAMIAELQPLASDPTLSSVAFRVTAEDTAPFTVTVNTPQLTPLFDLFAATAGVTQYSTTGTVVSVDVTAGDLRAAAAIIATAPRPDFISEIRITSDDVALYINGDETTEAQVGIAEAVFAIAATGDTVYFSAVPQPDATLTFSPTTYDAPLGNQIVDAVIASGLWKTSATVIAVADRPRVFTVEAAAGSPIFETTRTNKESETTRLVTELNTYWAEQQRAAQ